MKKSILLIVISVIAVFNRCNHCYAQYSFQRYDTIAVRENNTWLSNPWAGGLNNPQFSSIDLNGDGKKDIFIYDRSSDKILTFLNIGQAGEAKYKHHPEYETQFPPLHNWVLLVDFNNDGKEDIFTSGTYNAQIGIAVYRNISDASGLKFVRVNPPIMLADSAPINVSQWDIPSITDVDSDGDIDILTFEVSGRYVLFLRNLSVENFGTPDSLIFTQYDNCWGKFSENFATCNVTLGSTCRIGNPDSTRLPITDYQSPITDYRNNIPPQPLHAGSTILMLETNGDKAHELLVGDIVCTSMYLLVNGGDSINANMTSVYPAYPLVDSINLYRFPAAFLLDVNNDGIKDLIVTPNALNVSENFRGVWYYRNDGTNTIPNFVFQTKSFLQDEMIDVGENSYPAFLDYNADGKKDLLIGNYHYFSSSGNNPSDIALYENIGTAAYPSFQLVTRDFANLASLNFQAVFPTFGDLDDDGDADMIVGDFDGRLHYFENTAGKGNTVNFSQKVFPNIDIIDVGNYAAPQLVDVNRDGKLDLLIGERNGNLNYYQNTGSKSSPFFQFVTDSFGKVNVKKPGDVTGYSIPYLVDLDGFCNYSLLVGTERGSIFKYTNIDNNLNGIFTLADTNFLKDYRGSLASLNGADINTDGTVDLVVGNRGGGASIFLNKGVPAEVCLPPLDTDLVIFPNPVTSDLTVLISAKQGDEAEITIYNLLGQKCFSEKKSASGNRIQTIISLQSFRSGLYIIQIKAPDIHTNRKIVVMK